MNLTQQMIKCTWEKKTNIESHANLLRLLNFSTERKDKDQYIESGWIWEETSGHGGTLTEQGNKPDDHTLFYTCL